ncbi:hypothetical protein QFZ91_005624 [Paraburkholderia sp. JPY419]
MPYKARLKTGEPRKRKKPGYRVTNARAYNQSLRKRGMISLYEPGGDLKAQFINAKIRTPGVSGREPTYTTAYIELIFTFYRLFGWGMRQITGYMEDYWESFGRASQWYEEKYGQKAARTPWRKMHLSISRFKAREVRSRRPAWMSAVKASQALTGETRLPRCDESRIAAIRP